MVKYVVNGAVNLDRSIDPDEFGAVLRSTTS
jgi:hypothetical protein